MLPCATCAQTAWQRACNDVDVAEPLIDESTAFGARAARHLREEVVAWLTTVNPDGSPLPRPVWFLWDGGDSLLVYSMPGRRVRNLGANSRVTLNFGGDGQGGDIVVLSGQAREDPGASPANANAAYLDKYAARVSRMGMTPESFTERYSVPLRIELTGVRGH
jgi:PPOX class probable F420-dependent enzyme